LSHCGSTEGKRDLTSGLDGIPKEEEKEKEKPKKKEGGVRRRVVARKGGEGFDLLVTF